MTNDGLPYEVKRLVYDNASLPTIKSLRLVSKSWASAGLASLLLPSFSLKTLWDLQRLEELGTSESVAAEAGKVVKELVVDCDGWDPRYFRNIVCNRHELRRLYESVDFVPNEAESLALDELEQITTQKDIYTANYTRPSFSELLCHFNGASSIRFAYRNPFTHPILRKCWEEYSSQAFEVHMSKIQFLQMHHMLCSPLAPIRHLRHEQLLSTFFSTSKELSYSLSKLETLSLYICNIDDRFENEQEQLSLRNLIMTAPDLSSLSLTFESLGAIPLVFLPTAGIKNLETLSLGMITLLPSIFLPFLSLCKNTLKRIRLGNVKIAEGEGSFRSFLTSCQSIFCGTQLECFQLAGMTKSRDTGREEQWFLGPFGNVDASVWQFREMKNPRVKELEDFVIKGAPWPMVASDSIPMDID